MSPSQRRLPASARDGFTLLEVVVAIAIAGFTVTALYSLFTVQTRQFVTQDLQMEMHQNLRFATDMLTRSLRMAGYNTNGVVLGVMGESGSGDDLPVVISWDANGAGGTDAVTVVYGDPSLTVDSYGLPVFSTTEISFRTNIGNNAERLEQFEAGDLLLCFDYANSQGMKTYMWEVAADYDSSSAPGVITVNDASSYTDYANSFAATGNNNLGIIMTCTKANVFTFYIDDVDGNDPPGTSDHPVLMLDMDLSWPEADDVPLVDNIEDMQIEYCVDGTADNSTDCSQATSWSDSITSGTVDHLWMARVSLSARSSRNEPTGRYTSSRPALANHSGSSTPDSLFRDVLSTEVATRTIRYQDVP